MQYIFVFLRDVMCAFESLSISSEALSDPNRNHESNMSHPKFRSESDATLINCLRVYTWACVISLLPPCRPTLY